MSTVNYPNPRLDPTVRVFDQFYGFDQQVPAQEYDVVYSYFRSVFGTAEAAGNFTTTLFRVADESATPVLTLLQEIQGQSQPELTLTLCYYLNSVRSNATLLGVNAAVTPNFYAARNVRA